MTRALPLALILLCGCAAGSWAQGGGGEDGGSIDTLLHGAQWVSAALGLPAVAAGLGAARKANALARGPSRAHDALERLSAALSAVGERMDSLERRIGRVESVLMRAPPPAEA